MKTVSRLLALLAATVAALAHAASGIYAVPGPWVDDSSKSFSLASLDGNYTVATMSYGACRRVCSTSLRRLEELHSLAQQRHQPLRFVVFGLDASADKPSDWAEYRASHGLAIGDITFLAGPPAATRRLAGRLGVRYWRYGDHTMHDFRIVLVSPAGTIVRSVDHFDDDIATLLP